MTPERRIDINTLLAVYGTSKEGSTGQLLGDVIRELLAEIDALERKCEVIGDMHGVGLVLHARTRKKRIDNRLWLSHRWANPKLQYRND